MSNTKNPNYPKVKDNHPMIEYIRARQQAGLPVCDSEDHNTGCTNPDCPVWGNDATDDAETRCLLLHSQDCECA